MKALDYTQWASQVVLVVKNLPVIQETQEMQVWFLGQEEPLEDSTANHFSNLDWRMPQTAEPGGLQSKGHTESDTTEVT